MAVVTPTHGRPEALELCRLWMSRQTRQPDDWQIVDDAEIPPGWQNYCANLRIGIENANADAIVIVEDDDYYRPSYLELVDGWLSMVEIIGNQHIRYYDLRNRMWISERRRVSPLAQTAFRIEHRPLFIDVLERVARVSKPYVARESGETVDGGFWDSVRDRKLSSALPMSPFRWVGMKGMPGSAQISSVREQDRSRWSRDSEGLDQLRTYLGEDAEHYLPFVCEVSA